jgi:hypothetical protein
MKRNFQLKNGRDSMRLSHLILLGYLISKCDNYLTIQFSSLIAIVNSIFEILFCSALFLKITADS